MAWIELHDTLPDHHKVIDVAQALNMDKDLVVGKLVRLWTWALNNREDGAFRVQDIGTIAEVMRFKGKPQRLVDALTQHHLLDFDGDTYIIHDWDERVGMLLAKREMSRSQARDRKRKQREKSSNVTRDISVTNEKVTDECHACHAVTVPKPYQDDDEDDVDDLLRRRAGAGAYMRENGDNPYTRLYDEADRVIRVSFKCAYNRDATNAEVECLSRIAVLNEKTDLIGEAIRRAAAYGARSVVSYVSKIVKEWRYQEIDTEDELAEYDLWQSVLNGELEGCAEDAIKQMQEHRERKRALRTGGAHGK